LPEADKKVRMGGYSTGKDDEVVAALGLGSCVAVCLYCEEKSVAGVAHVMLPRKESRKSEKRADILIDKLIGEINSRGVETQKISSKIFGGASMFGNRKLNVGQENIESVEEILEDYNIPIVSRDTGGEKGRSVWISCVSGKVILKKFGECEEHY